MAEIPVQPGTKFQITGTGQYILGDASDDTVSTYIVHLVDNSSTTASITVKARSRAPQALTGTITQAPTGSGSTLDDIAFVAVAYYNEATGLYSTSALTTATLPIIATIRSSGLQICLDCTAIAAGGVNVYVQRVFGAAA